MIATRTGRHLVTGIVLTVASVLGAASASAQQLPAHMELTANGEQIEGESSYTTFDRENTIELSKVGNEMLVALGPGGGPVEVEAKPLVFRTKLSKATPSLIKALTEGEQIEARIRFFRASSDGVLEHYFTIEVSNARLTRYRSASSTSSTDQLTFEFEMIYGSIAWTYESTGSAHQWEFRDAT